MANYDENQIQYLELTAKTTEKVQSFNSLMITVGYATFFALWANIKGCATPASHMAAGALLGASAVLFVAWHIVGMVTMNVAVMSLLSVTNGRHSGPVEQDAIAPVTALNMARQAVNDPNSGLTPANRATLRMTLASLRIAKFWPYTLATILLPALLGMAILFSTYVHGAWLGHKGQTLQCTAPSKG